MLCFVTGESYRTGIAVLSFNIRSIGLPFLPVQCHFSQAKMDILVCFPCGVYYLPISLNLCSKVGVHWPAPTKFTRQVELWAVLWNKELGIEQQQEWVTFLKERLACVTTDVRVWWGVSHCSGWALLRACISLCMGSWRGKATGKQPSWTPLLMERLGLLRRENIPNPFTSPTLYW